MDTMFLVIACIFVPLFPLAARLRSIPAFCQAGQLAGQVSQTHGTTPVVAAIAAPTTFTAYKGPVVFLD